VESRRNYSRCTAAPAPNPNIINRALNALIAFVWFVFLFVWRFTVFAVDGGTFEVGSHQDCELRDLATVERS
jgi:hypothetical protein